MITVSPLNNQGYTNLLLPLKSESHLSLTKTSVKTFSQKPATQLSKRAVLQTILPWDVSCPRQPVNHGLTSHAKYAQKTKPSLSYIKYSTTNIFMRVSISVKQQ